MVYAQEQKPNHVGNPAALELHFTRVWLFCHIFLSFIIFYKIGYDVTWDINREKVQSWLHINFPNNSIKRKTAYLQNRKGQLINIAYVSNSNGNIAIYIYGLSNIFFISRVFRWIPRYELLDRITSVASHRIEQSLSNWIGWWTCKLIKWHLRFLTSSSVYFFVSEYFRNLSHIFKLRRLVLYKNHSV